MLKIDFYLDNTLMMVPPYNWKELSTDLNFDTDRPQGKSQIALTDFEFTGVNAQKINDIRLKGLSTGVGVFEGIPFRGEVSNNGFTLNLFDGYLDTTSNPIYSPNRITLKFVQNDSVDSLNDKLDSVTFNHLFDIGIIKKSDFTHVPYVLNSVPNYLEAVTATIGVYVMVKEIKDAIQRIAEFIPELPVYYVFSTYIKLILYIVYLIFLLIALIKLVKQVILLLIQPIKYHATMSLKLHLEKAAEYLGYGFSCNFLDTEPFKDTYIIPEKFYNQINKKEKQILGFTEPSIEQIGYYKGTPGDLIRECKNIYNSKITLANGVITMSRVDDAANANYTMPDMSNNYDIRTPEFTLNTDDFSANTLISFLTDSTDKNTMQDYLGTSFQVIIEPSRVNNNQMTLMKGFNEVRIGFALAKTKTDLTVPEKIFDVFLKIFDGIAGALIKAVNAIIKVLNKVIDAVNDILDKLKTIGIKLNFKLPNIPIVETPDFSNKAKNRIGMLKIETDLIGINKICRLKVGNKPLNTKIAPVNDLVYSAKFLYENMHYVNSFVPTTDRPNANQWIKYTFNKMPLSLENYVKILNNNSIFTNDGENAIVDSLKWNAHAQIAETINFRVNKLYTNNFKQSYSEPDGR